jgi:N-acetylmuramoyl-L-alanine amidase
MTPRLKRFALFALLATPLAASIPAVGRALQPTTAVHSHGVEVKGVRVWAEPDNTRVVLDLSGSAPHTLAVLQHPDRVIVDLPAARVANGARVVPSGVGAVEHIRVADGPRGALRLVIDLLHPIRAKSFLVQPNSRYGYRLVIDLGAMGSSVASGAVRPPGVGVRQAGSPTVAAGPSRPSGPSGLSGLSGLPRASGPSAAAGASARTGSPDAGSPVEPAEAAETAYPAAARSGANPVKVAHRRPEARDLIIAVDAGHGGDDPGAIGKNGTQEKDVVLAIARALKKSIDLEPGMRAVLTRDGDYFVPLRDRMRRARAQQADLFVSIHADSVRDRSVDGSSVYILSQRGATDEASRWLAERENASDLIGGVSLEDKGDVLASVLLDLSQSASLTASHAAAEEVLRQLTQVGEVRKPQVQEARFMVLKSPDIPSMLVETAYISNPQEEQRLRGAAHQAKLAGAIHQGVRAYFYSDPPAGTRIAQMVEAGTGTGAATARPTGHPVMATAEADSGG